MELAYAYNTFYSESRRGWYWFEKENVLDTMNQPKINPEIATQIMKQFTADLHKARMQVFVQPTQKNMLDYLRLEEQMWKRSIELFHLFEMTQFKYLEFNDEPVNVETIRMNREQHAKLTKSNIADISKKFNLVIFISGECKFCKEFEYSSQIKS
jgi:hypothetical protein